MLGRVPRNPAQQRLFRKSCSDSAARWTLSLHMYLYMADMNTYIHVYIYIYIHIYIYIFLYISIYIISVARGSNLTHKRS